MPVKILLYSFNCYISDYHEVAFFCEGIPNLYNDIDKYIGVPFGTIIAKLAELIFWDVLTACGNRR